MPTVLTRLFGRARAPRGDERTAGLRLAVALTESGRPLRTLDLACRLALRTADCAVAVVGVWSGEGDEHRLTLPVGRARDGDARALSEALAARQSPAQSLGEQPRWIQLAEDQFQPGSPLLRRFDLHWALILPIQIDAGDGTQVGFVFLGGRAPETTLDHPLLREARLIWSLTRERLARPATGAVSAPGAARSGADGWQDAPAALALVEPERVVAVNDRARELLTANVGRDGKIWEPWLLGAVQRLDAAGVECEVLTASQSRNRQLEIRVGPIRGRERPRFVCLHEVGQTKDDSADQEAAMRMLSHELRTPLAAMQTSLELVTRGDAGALTADQSRFLGTARRNLERLNRLLGDLLDAKCAEAGRLAIRPETVDLGALLGEDLAMFGVACREKGIEFDATGVPAEFRACVDADKVQQMLHNLVSNSIKYTPAGGMIRIWLHDRPDVAPGAGVRLARRFGLPLDAFTLVVEDSGLGMSEEFLGSLFQPFCREDRAETRGLPGAGLGLHITRGLVEAHGGEIRLDSHPGQGTTVWLVLPREPSSGRVLIAGRQLDGLRTAAANAHLPEVAVCLDVRARVGRFQPWEVEAAATEVREFLRNLARANRHPAAPRVLREDTPVSWQLAAGLWAGVALDPDRLAPAWQVATSAPESSLLLAGTSWQALDDDAAAIAQPVAPGSAKPVG
ncbi:MAG TPA: ATP-binding protein [Candidatus Krumholzibacteria bacterium]|nr:ATP-binding protein [Candidatus Krumholzibacteria bacterium]HPD71086.1 ATP-binding protein [Candidatus Krumholzibacteria bacterium]HRY39214.1 ATP-binding protein [Candidatus Krumholzibacteria bacterium]